MMTGDERNGLLMRGYNSDQETEIRRSATSANGDDGYVFPSFLVVGPPRTGTSWLYEALKGHANLPYPTKETRFFDLHFHRGLDWYLHHFRNRERGKVAGEVAPTYFASPEARERIARTIPDVKVIFVFRQPVERIISLYRMKRAYGMMRWTLEEALECDPELVRSSRYATYLEEWQRTFPRRNLSINFYEDLQQDPQRFLDSVTDFVGIPRFSLHHAPAGKSKVYSSADMTEPKSYLATKAANAAAEWCKARKLDSVVYSLKRSRWSRIFLGGGAPFSEVAEPTLNRISKMVLPEVERLEAMLGRDLSDWKRAPLESAAVSAGRG